MQINRIDRLTELLSVTLNSKRVFKEFLLYVYPPLIWRVYSALIHLALMNYHGADIASDHCALLIPFVSFSSHERPKVCECSTPFQHTWKIKLDLFYSKFVAKFVIIGFKSFQLFRSNQICFPWIPLKF